MRQYQHGKTGFRLMKKYCCKDSTWETVCYHQQKSWVWGSLRCHLHRHNPIEKLLSHGLC